MFHLERIDRNFPNVGNKFIKNKIVFDDSNKRTKNKLRKRRRTIDDKGIEVDIVSN